MFIPFAKLDVNSGIELFIEYSIETQSIDI
jgi:hypothetical protein